jgi:putative endopeptidase
MRFRATPGTAWLIVVLTGGALVTAAPVDAPRSGLDPATFDRSVRPQDDLFGYVNASWIAATEIPPDRASYGTFEALADQSEQAMRGIIEGVIASGPHRQGSSAQQIADLYTSMLDEARVDALGASPMAPELRRIDAIVTPRDLAAEAGYLTAIAAGGPFGGSVAVDARDPTRLVVQISQGGTLLPDREYYVSADPKFVAIRQQYEAYLARVLTLAGRPGAAADAHAVLDLETALAKAQWTLADSRDPLRTDNRFALDSLARTMPGFDWAAWARPQGIDRAQGVVLFQPSFFKAFAALVPVTPLGTWKAWLAARYITALAPYLSRPFSDARFEFFGSVLAGQESVRVAWKRGVGLASWPGSRRKWAIPTSGATTTDWSSGRMTWSATCSARARSTTTTA